MVLEDVRLKGRAHLAAALALLLLAAPVLAAEEDKSTEEKNATPLLVPGATDQDKAALTRNPSVWATLRAQWEYPARPQPRPHIPGTMLGPAEMTLRAAVMTSLANNPALLSESLTPLFQEQGILAATAQFDPILGADLNFGRATEPSSSLLQGANLVQQNYANWDFSLKKMLRSGAMVEAVWTNSRFKTDNTFFDLNPTLTPEASITIAQPLLRNFGLYFSTLRIKLAETATEAAIESYRANVADFITLVIRAYWRVVLATETRDVLQGSYELALKTVRDNRTRVDVGVLPPVAVKESQAEAARRHEEVIVAANQLEHAQRDLQNLVYLPGQSEFFPRRVTPIENPTHAEREVPGLEAAIETAMAERPEIHAARLAVRTGELNVAMNKNQLLPQVDIYGMGGVNGLGGVVRTGDNPFSGQPYNQDFAGSYSQSLNRMIDGRNYSYAAGVRIEVAIGNAGAQANFRQARIVREQMAARYRQQVSDIALDVSQSLGDLTSNLERMKATRVAREFSEENLRNQSKRYDVGMATTTDLLKFQNDVASSKLAEIRSVIDYNNSLARFERSQGSILDRFNVEIAPRGKTDFPWWSF
ncbi:MAG: TolC family protein [Deltaproteobacteria bacterium]